MLFHTQWARVTVPVLLVLALAAASAAAAEPGAGPLAVRACGASGAEFQTTATTTAGSNQITVANVGDFQVGQGVMVSRCNVRYQNGTLWGPRAKYAASAPLKDAVEMRGYDGSSGSWTVFVLDVIPGTPHSFRWSDDLGRTWKPIAPITGDWQPLSGGTQVRFGKRDWEAGYAVTFSARDQLVSTIEKIEGKVLTLKDAANRSAADAVVRHCDDAGLQAAMDRAVKEKRNVYLPPGTYRLSKSVEVREAGGLTIEGQDGVHTLLDISEGEGPCLSLRGGTEVTLRNLRFLGNMGFDQRDQAGVLSLRGALAVWGFYLKLCAALHISGPQRVFVENCHASKMSAECFYSQSPGRSIPSDARRITEAITYLRCSVTDCARNAFNNNDAAENTSVLFCRIVDVGGCTWEGASRFVKFTGNYVRNGGTVAMGNVRSRSERFEMFPRGQHIISDNVFESVVPYGGCAIRAAGGATPVLITNNLFVNFGSSGVEISGAASDRELPAAVATVTGNMFDMTEVGPNSARRHAVEISASDVIVADNQIYVRGAADAQVTGIRVREPATNVQVHNNLIRNCGAGIATARAASRVFEVVDGKTFVAAGPGVPFERRQSHRYAGWNVAWFTGGRLSGTSTIEAFDPETVRFRLKEARPLKPGDTFEVFAPAGGNWSFHHNTLAGCLAPAVLDCYGGETCRFAENTLSRDGAVGVKAALDLRGRFTVSGNQIAGFDEAGAAGLALSADRAGRPSLGLFRGNVFQNCAVAVAQASPGLWEKAVADGNLFLECGATPKQGAAPAPQKITPVLIAADKSELALSAPYVRRAPTIDGALAEWPLSDKGRTVPLARTPNNDPLPAARGVVSASHDGSNLYLAIRVTGKKGAPVSGAGWGNGDGVEVSFQSADPKRPSPIFLVWGTAGGAFEAGNYGGATPEQLKTLTAGARYAAKAAADGWVCEWRLPLAALGLSPATLAGLRLNVGVHDTAGDQWFALVGTGGNLYQVDQRACAVKFGK